jgi:hypothetical protein
VRLPSADELLSAAVEQLEYDRGVLLRASERPEKGRNTEWTEKGDWLALAHKVGADQVFFIDQHPVAVFAKFDGDDAAAFRQRYNAIWCMARPQLLFMAREGELTAFDLSQPPMAENETTGSQQRVLDRVETIAGIQSKLAAFHRERVETGAIFGEQHFGDGLQRADRALIRDLKQMRRALSEVALQPATQAPANHHLHALIGRAIFVRYLEDRGIITFEYFERVAARRREWTRLLSEPLDRPVLDSALAGRWFFRVLRSKEFTYALFEALADDFNGDTFPLDDEEFARISPKHLSLLQSFLLGEAPHQQSLFFRAYRFDVIPIELISTIYEEFYNENVGDEHNQGSHYTPPALVEFVLGRTLTPEVLATRPRVCDPSCGSGIFLVEAFRRIVRHQWAVQAGRKLSRDQLLKILREQIAGIDINEEAVRVAAFSLCLAFLHYQSPPEINADRLLPHLKWLPEAERLRRSGKKKQAQFFNALLCANAFEVNADKFPSDAVKHFGPGTATVVVGNPPWGDPKPSNDDERAAKAAVKAWCEQGKYPVGDKEMSQAFIHLTLALLTKGGRAGLLVSSGVLFKHHENSRAFRRTWLAAAQLRHVVNFSHVRHLFFSDGHRDTAAISPFVSVVFDKSDAEIVQDNRFAYWSAKRTAVIEGTKSVILNRGDMHWLSQHACMANEQLWKIYWWGGHRDEALVQALKVFPELQTLGSVEMKLAVRTGRGFQEANKADDADWLANYRELPAEHFHRYGPIDTGKLVTVPAKIERRGCREVYFGRRLLVSRGIKQGGFITARFETKKYCFRHSIHGARLERFDRWQEAVVIGIFWSSVARYFYWMISGSWGFWHHEINLEDVERMPIAFPNDTKLRNRIVRIVEELQSLELAPDGLELGGMAAQSRLPKLEQELDEAVFDLYGLNQAERDLIREMCSLGLDLFYRRQASEAVQPVEHPVSATGTLADVARAKDSLGAYLHTFLEIWNDELAAEGEFGWQVLSPPTGAPLLAVCFVTRFKGSAQQPSASSRMENWRTLLERLAQDSLVPSEGGGILVDTFYRYVSEHEIVIFKRNERRFWTRTAAREDAEAIMLKLMSEAKMPSEA